MTNAPLDPRFKKILQPLLAAAALGMMVGCSSQQGGNVSESSSSPSNTDAGTAYSSESAAFSSVGSPTATSSAYKDGTYSATGNYTSPAGQETVDVTVRIANGIVTDAQFTGHGQNPVSQMRQQAFKEGFQAQVVGKPIDQISLGVVNGSSLAPKGFIDALNKIKVEAQA